jgi:hypothetical protein
MARLYGRAPKGGRCLAAVPHGHWKTTTFTAGLRIGGLAAPFVLDGPMDGDAFRVYVSQVLAPELTTGDVVIMDNLPAHKVHGVRHAIEAAGATLLYLPAYSPDFNPIEMAPPSSRRSCAPQPRELSLICGTPSASRSTPSRQASAKIISPPLDMTPHDRKML